MIRPHRLHPHLSVGNSTIEIRHLASQGNFAVTLQIIVRLMRPGFKHDRLRRLAVHREASIFYSTKQEDYEFTKP
jgi:hypothetical protein